LTGKKEIETLKKEIEALLKELQLASIDRKKENLEFQRMVSDQRLMQVALTKAQGKLQKVFGPSFAQQEPGEQQFHERGSGPRPTVAPAPEFQDYDSKSGESTSVLVLIQKLIGDAKIVEDESVSDEQNAQDAYNKLIADTNAAVKAKQRMIVSRTEELAAYEEQLHEVHIKIEIVIREIRALNETKGAIHTECDFILQYYDARRAARNDEIVALQDAKAIVSGMKE
jgi:hypothetical protein